MSHDGLFIERDGRYMPTEFTRGPWRTDAQHGGPPAALLTHVTLPLVDASEFLNHIEVELTRPVPLSPLRTRTERTRVSGRVHRIAAELLDDEIVVARSNALALRCSDFPEPEITSPVQPAVDPPGANKAVEAPRWASGDVTAYHRNAVEHRFVDGDFRVPGPAVDWIRLRQPLVAGHDLSGFERVMAAADFGSGISAVYGVDSPFGLINANLAVSFIRQPRGEWVSVDAETHVGEQGTGLCISRLGDTDGLVAIATQSLLGYAMG